MLPRATFTVETPGRNTDAMTYQLQVYFSNTILNKTKTKYLYYVHYVLECITIQWRLFEYVYRVFL